MNNRILAPLTLLGALAAPVAKAGALDCGHDLDSAVSGTAYNTHTASLASIAGIPGGYGVVSDTSSSSLKIEETVDGGKTFSDVTATVIALHPDLSSATQMGITGHSPSANQAVMYSNGGTFLIDNFDAGAAHWSLTSLSTLSGSGSAGYGSVDDTTGDIVLTAYNSGTYADIENISDSKALLATTSFEGNGIYDSSHDRLAHMTYPGKEFWLYNPSTGASELQVSDATPTGYVPPEYSPTGEGMWLYATLSGELMYCNDGYTSALTDTGEPDTGGDTAEPEPEEEEEECIPVANFVEGSDALTDGSTVCTEGGAAVDVAGSVINESGSSTFVLDSAGDKISVEKDPALEVVADSSSYNGNSFRSSGADENGLTTWSLTLGVAGATDSVDILEVTAGEVVGTCGGVETSYGVGKYFISSCLDTDTGDTGGADDDTGDTGDGGDSGESGDSQDSAVIDSAQPETGDSDVAEPDTDDQEAPNGQTVRPENPDGCGGCDTEGNDSTGLGLAAVSLAVAATLARRKDDEPPAQPVRVRVQ